MPSRYPWSKPKKLTNGNMQVPTFSGIFELPANGEITPDVIEAFTTGHCHSFALAMNEVTGWKMYGTIVGYSDTPDDPSHVILEHPSGRFVDITGFLHHRDRWLRGSVVRVSKEDIKKFKSYLKPRPELAKPFVKTVLAQVGGMVPASAQLELNLGARA